jgi:hypothetical protein
LCCPPPSFASNDFVHIRKAGQGTNKNRLDDALLADGISQILEFCVIEGFSGIFRVRTQEFGGNCSSSIWTFERYCRLSDISDESGEAAAQA